MVRFCVQHIHGTYRKAALAVYAHRTKFLKGKE